MSESKLWASLAHVAHRPTEPEELAVFYEDAMGLSREKREEAAEMEQFRDDWARIEPRRWQPSRGALNLWGPMPSWRTVRSEVESDSGR